MERNSILTDRQTDRRNSIITRLLLKDRAVLRNSPCITLSHSNRVNLNAWIVPNSTHNNVGDYLSLIVAENVCNMNGIQFDQKTSKTRHLYAVGSILPGYQNAVVWGSGFGYNKPKTWCSFAYNWLHRYYHHLDVRAVRGPETRRILTQMGIRCPTVYGDPAVLMPLFYPGTGRRGSREYLVIPHYSKLDAYKGVENVLGTFVKDYHKFIDTLLEAKLVISSSLHGIILAEAYGIPAVMLSDTPTTDITKYKDWYYSTGRYSFPIANTVEEALSLGGTPLDRSIIQDMQNNLLNSFPLDLWND